MYNSQLLELCVGHQSIAHEMINMSDEMSDVLPLREKRVIISSGKYITLAIMVPEEKRAVLWSKGETYLDDISNHGKDDQLFQWEYP